ncbi:MAG: hypothetical protein LBT05_15400 [Planctomycetaceae bacterium]|jgi:hypothetical protein|nr:hypothetical protein [Planctomycetaceae bacterium]
MNKLCVLFFVLTLFVSCSNTFPKIEEINIDNNYREIKLENKNGKSTYNLYCKITGKIEGDVEIEFMVDDGTSKKIIPENGKVNFLYDTDWYTNHFIIKIFPKDNVNGNIKIIYKFSTL